MSRALLLWLLLALAGCASFPTERPGVLPRAVQPANASAERAALNTRVYDAVLRHTAASFYRRDAIDAGFRAEAQARRAAAQASPDEAGLYAVVGGLLRTLDDAHTYATSPTLRARIEARRQGQGSATWGLLFVDVPREHAGLVGTRSDDGTRPTLVLQVREDGAAAAAGVQVGWQLLSIDGVPMRDAAPPVAGQARQFLFVDDAGQTRALSITAREMPPLPRQQRARLDGDIAWLRFDDFDRRSRDWLRVQLAELAGDPPAGVVLDLRQNGGGSLGIATQVLGMFTEGRPVLGRMQRRWLHWSPRARRAADTWHGPLVLLIGPATGSASELLAAALQETGRAVLVGQGSAGAAVASVGFNLPDGGLLRVGSMAMTSQGGRALDKVGVLPDHTVPRDWAALRAGRDPALDKAVQLLRDGHAAPALNRCRTCP